MSNRNTNRNTEPNNYKCSECKKCKKFCSICGKKKKDYIVIELYPS